MSSGSAAPFEPTARSNFPHQHAYVVQAWDTGVGWLDTRFGADTLERCRQEAIPDALQPDRWMQDQPGKVRIIRSRQQ